MKHFFLKQLSVLAVVLLACVSNAFGYTITPIYNEGCDVSIYSVLDDYWYYPNAGEASGEITAGSDVYVYVYIYNPIYYVKSMTVDGTDVTTEFKKKDEYLFSSISANHTVEIELAKVATNSITVSSSNGSVYFKDSNDNEFCAYDGIPRELVKGQTYKMYIFPEAGYDIDKIQLQHGSDIQDITSDYRTNFCYEFPNLTEDYSVTVTYKSVPTKKISIGAYDESMGDVFIKDVYGKTTWLGSDNFCEFNEGSTLKMVVESGYGYIYDAVTVAEGSSPATDITETCRTQGYYEFTNLSADYTVNVNFREALQYDFTINYDQNFGNAYLYVNDFYSDGGSFYEGDNILMRIDPNTGYTASATVDGVAVDLVLNKEVMCYDYSLPYLDADHLAEVTFTEVGTYEINTVFVESQVSVMLNNGTCSSNGGISFTQGMPLKLILSPAIGYELASLTVGSKDVTSSYTEKGYYEFVADNDYTITVTMKKKTSASGKETIAISDAGQCTYCSEYDLNFEGVEGITAYIVSGFSASTSNVVLTKVVQVPAGTGLYIKGDAGSYDIPIESTDYYFSNMLKGIVKDTWIYSTEDENGIEYTNYILAKTSGGVCFCKSNGDGELTANKAYLRLPSSLAQARSVIGIAGGDNTTAIDAQMLQDDAEGAIYNLKGQKVENPTKGIYIKNGKKFIVR